MVVGLCGGLMVNRSVFKSSGPTATSRLKCYALRPARLGHCRMSTSSAPTIPSTFRRMESCSSPRTTSTSLMKSGCSNLRKKSEFSAIRNELERRLAKAQGIGNHGDGAEAHCRASKHGAQQPAEYRVESAGGDRNSDRIVEKGERQILFDISNRRAAQLARSHDSAQVALHQRDARVFNRRVRSSPHGDSYIGCRQRRRVVNSVTGHRNNATLIFQILYDLAFPLGPDFRLNLFDLQLLGYRLCGFRPITGDHYHSQALCLQLLDRSGR